MRLKHKIGYYAYLAVLGIAVVFAPAGQLVAHAQSTTEDGSTGTASVTLDSSQSSTTLQNAALNGMKWFGNLACPIIGTGFGIHSIVQWRAGGKPIPSLATCIGCYTVSGGLLLVQHWIQNANSATGLSTLGN